MIRVCAYSKCGEEFEARTHNQVYCTDEHCKRATNDKIKQRYHEKKARRAGQDRRCKQCNHKLSRYNDDVVCNSCANSRSKESKEELLRIVGLYESSAA